MEFTATVRDLAGHQATHTVPILTVPRPVLCPVQPRADVDQTPALKAWISGLPVGTPAQFAGTYRADTSLIISGRRLDLRGLSLDVRAPSTEIDSQGRSLRRHLWLQGCTGSVDVKVSGGNTVPDLTPAAGSYDPKREWEHALAADDCNSLTVTNLDAYGVWGDGLYLRRCNDATVQKWRVERNGRQGAAVVAGRRIKLLNGTIVYGRRSGIDLEPNSPTDVVSDVEIGTLDVTSRLIPITAGGDGAVTDVNVHDVRIGQGALPAINAVPAHAGAERSRWTVERVSSSFGYGASIYAIVEFGQGHDYTLRDVQLPAQQSRSMTGVRFRSCSGPVELTRCDFGPFAAKLWDSVTSPGLSVTCTGNRPAA